MANLGDSRSAAVPH